MRGFLGTLTVLAIVSSVGAGARAQDAEDEGSIERPDAGTAAAMEPGEGDLPLLEPPEESPAAPVETGGEGGPRVELPDTLPGEPSAAGEPSAEPAEERERGSLPIGGYGELHFNLTAPSDGGDTNSVLDLHRMVLFVAHRFQFGLSFNLELEVEHAFVAGEDTPGEIAIEQAYVDYPLVRRYLGVRAGVVLVPMGIINQRHEPPTFNGVERPMVSRSVVPTTWREGGIGLFGELFDGFRYEIYVTTGLDASGFSLGSGIRGGRQHVGEASIDGIAITGRLEYLPTPWLVAGVSGYWGRAGPNVEGVYSSCDADTGCVEFDEDVPVGGAAADLRLRWRGLEARAEVAFFTIGDTEALRAAVDAAGVPLGIDVGSIILGAYVEVGWDVLSLATTRHRLVPFARYEFYDPTLTHDDPEIARSRATHDLVVGLTYLPIRQVAFKADVVLRNPGVGDTLFNLGVGWMF